MKNSFLFFPSRNWTLRNIAIFAQGLVILKECSMNSCANE
nr:MAG TPA: hypothetical protein [Caudoviricetes sp.]